MSSNQEASFEQRLRKAVRRLSRKGHHDDDIREVLAHYDDLAAEAKAKGMPDDEAAKFAEQLLGDPKVVAGQIAKNRPKIFGIRLQWVAILLFVFLAISPNFIGMKGYVVGSMWGNFVEFWRTFSVNLTYLCGGIFAFGVFRAKRVSALALGVGALLIPASYLGYSRIRYPDLAQADISAKMHFSGIVRHRTTYRTALEGCLGALDKLLSNPTPTLVRQVSNLPRELTATCMITPKTSHGDFAYPTKYQVLREGVIPTIFFERTNSLEYAMAQWRSADKLRAVLPSMKFETQRHFEFYDEIQYQNMTLMGQIKQYALGWYQILVASVGFSLIVIAVIDGGVRFGRRPRKIR